MKRPRERVREIDQYIRKNYPTDGPEKVAQALGETKNYVMQRAHYLKTPMKRKNGSSTKRRKTQKEINQELRYQNSELRRELIKQTHLNRKLKMRVSGGVI